MQFTSFTFAVFFPVVVLIFYILPKKARQIWLLLASYYFYMGWNPKYALLILTSTVITYLCGLGIDMFSAEKKRVRKAVLLAGILSNLGILIFFKYFYFLHDSVAAVVSIFGIHMKASSLDIVLPVGISFYTFQALGYVIDVYRQQVKAEKNFIRYALFVSFFPQLVAGPIERSGHLLSQIEEISRKPSWNFDKVTRGLLMILWGYFMKLVIADRAAALVDTVFPVYYMFDGVALVLTMIMFGFQLYCDFASYSAIAIGASSVLGIELCPNFAAPFFSSSVSEFWRRWHISLSSWLRDYVYIPLGGNRCSRVRKYFNIMVTFLTSGIWHGASWHFVLWGALQGIFIVIGDMLRPAKTKFHTVFHVKTQSVGFRCGQVCMTYLLFLVSFTFFRAPTISDGVYYLERIVRHFDIWALLDGSVYTLGLDAKEMLVFVIAVAILWIVDWYYQKKKAYFDTLVKNQCLAVQYLIVLTLFVMILVFGVYGEGYNASEFIYFQF